MPVLEDDVLLFEAVEDDEMAEMVEAVGATGKGKGGRMQLLWTTWNRPPGNTAEKPPLKRPLSPVATWAKLLWISEYLFSESLGWAESEMTTTAGRQSRQWSSTSEIFRTDWRISTFFAISDWLKLRRTTFTPPMSRAHHVAIWNTWWIRMDDRWPVATSDLWRDNSHLSDCQLPMVPFRNTKKSDIRIHQKLFVKNTSESVNLPPGAAISSYRELPRMALGSLKG